MCEHNNLTILPDSKSVSADCSTVGISLLVETMDSTCDSIAGDCVECPAIGTNGCVNCNVVGTNSCVDCCVIGTSGCADCYVIGTSGCVDCCVIGTSGCVDCCVIGTSGCVDCCVVGTNSCVDCCSCSAVGTDGLDTASVGNLFNDSSTDTSSSVSTSSLSVISSTF